MASNPLYEPVRGRGFDQQTLTNPTINGIVRGTPGFRDGVRSTNVSIYAQDRDDRAPIMLRKEGNKLVVGDKNTILEVGQIEAGAFEQEDTIPVGDKVLSGELGSNTEVVIVPWAQGVAAGILEKIVGENRVVIHPANAVVDPLYRRLQGRVIAFSQAPASIYSNNQCTFEYRIGTKDYETFGPVTFGLAVLPSLDDNEAQASRMNTLTFSYVSPLNEDHLPEEYRKLVQSTANASGFGVKFTLMSSRVDAVKGVFVPTSRLSFENRIRRDLQPMSAIPEEVVKGGWETSAQVLAGRFNGEAVTETVNLADNGTIVTIDLEYPQFWVDADYDTSYAASQESILVPIDKEVGVGADARCSPAGAYIVNVPRLQAILPFSHIRLHVPRG